jgi:hypothetical protein
VTSGPGRNLCFTVGHDVDFIASKHARPRINMVRHPSLLVLDHEGNDALFISEGDHAGFSVNLCESNVSNRRGERLFIPIWKHICERRMFQGTHLPLV